LFQEGSEVIHRNKEFEKYKGTFDLVFTSPPYFNREQYSADESQSFKKFPSYEDWKENFLRPTLRTASQYLRNDRYLLWNIADITHDGGYIPLEEDSKNILQEYGLEYVETLKMLMATMRGDRTTIKNCCQINGELHKYEPIFVFYKK
jgi:DNA modification methylase